MKQLKTFLDKLILAAKSFIQTWKSDFPNMGQMKGSHICKLPNGQPAISLAEAVRRGAWLYKDEPKVEGAQIWDPGQCKAI